VAEAARRVAAATVQHGGAGEPGRVRRTEDRLGERSALMHVVFADEDPQQARVAKFHGPSSPPAARRDQAGSRAAGRNGSATGTKSRSASRGSARKVACSSWRSGQ